MMKLHKSTSDASLSRSSNDLERDDSSMSNSGHDQDKDDKLKKDAKKARMEEEKSKLASSENKAVAYLRILVLFVLLLVAVGMSVGVYFYTHNDEMEEFEAGFLDAAGLLMDSFHSSVESQLGAIGAMSATITAQALATNQTLPFATIDDFEMQAAHTRIAAKTVAIQWCPILKSEDQREEWEAYAMERRFHIDAAYERDAKYRAEQDEAFGVSIGLEDETEGSGTRHLQENPSQLQDGTGYHTRVWNVRTKEPEPEGIAPYVVTWQRSPVNALKQKFLNLNIAQAPALEGGLVPTIIETGKVVINKAVVPVEGSVAQFSSNLMIGQYRENTEEYNMDPVSFVAYPVFDKFDRDTKELVGLVVTNLYWRLHFKDVLSEGDKGYICVLENSFGQSLRYRVDGSHVTFLGEGPHEDTKFRHMEQFQDVNQYMKDRAGLETNAYQRASLDQTFNRYTLKIYPSQETEDSYVTNQPAIFTAAVALAFFLATLIFIVYDLLIARRQRIVMDRALQSGAIVASLFPEKVRNRIYEETAEETKMIASTGSGVWKNNGAAMKEAPQTTDTLANADVFPSTTVMFADLKGFTKWSSSRSPSDVFILLENLYSEFDKIADRRDIFKIETIGDCYVAVAGLPNPQKDHAVRMTKFSNECMAKMSSVVRDLSVALGEDTADLQLRVGLHSGPVTAGVLRGARSRFQLFGDTVNTAARMESNGVPGRIHISGATAAELSLRGKESWISEREDKIVAKGKGEMTTYWAVPSPARTTTGSSVVHTVSSDLSLSNHSHPRNESESMVPPEPIELGNGAGVSGATECDC